MKWNWGSNATGFITYDKEGRVTMDIKAEKSIFPSIAGLMFDNILAMVVIMKLKTIASFIA